TRTRDDAIDFYFANELVLVSYLQPHAVAHGASRNHLGLHMDRHLTQDAILDPPGRSRPIPPLSHTKATRFRQEMHERRKVLQKPTVPGCSKHRHWCLDTFLQGTYTRTATMEDCLRLAHEDLRRTACLTNEGTSLYG